MRGRAAVVGWMGHGDEGAGRGLRGARVRGNACVESSTCAHQWVLQKLSSWPAAVTWRIRARGREGQERGIHTMCVDLCPTAPPSRHGQADTRGGLQHEGVAAGGVAAVYPVRVQLTHVRRLCAWCERVQGCRGPARRWCSMWAS